MTVCKFFLQGWCRYGDNCWNYHPRQGGRQQYQYQRGFTGSQGGWGSSSYRSPQYSAQQPSDYSKQVSWSSARDKSNSGSNFSTKKQDVEKKGFQKNDASSFNFSVNRFAALSADKKQDDDEKLLESIKTDMEVWESSGKWPLSTYSAVLVKKNISGFTDISPEELRHQFYTSRADGTMQNYITSVQQLMNQWKSRILELKTQPPSAKASLVAELMNASSQTTTSLGFGSHQTSSIGKSGFATGGGSSSMFSFKAEPVFGSSGSSSTSLFGTASSQPAPSSSVVSSGFGSSTELAFNSPVASGFGSSTQTSAFGTSLSSGSGSASSFSFTIPASSGSRSAAAPVFGISAPSGFGSSSVFGNVTSTLAPMGFGTSTTSVTGGLSFGSVTSSPALSGGLGIIGSATDAFSSSDSAQHAASVPGVSSSTAASGLAAVYTSQKLFTPQNELTADELREFKAKRFSLGMIPLRPPPKELLII